MGLIEDLPGALLDLRYQDHYGLMEVYMAKLRSHHNKQSMPGDVASSRQIEPAWLICHVISPLQNSLFFWMNDEFGGGQT